MTHVTLLADIVPALFCSECAAKHTAQQIRPSGITDAVDKENLFLSYKAASRDLFTSVLPPWFWWDRPTSCCGVDLPVRLSQIGSLPVILIILVLNIRYQNLQHSESHLHEAASFCGFLSVHGIDFSVSSFQESHTNCRALEHSK